MKKNEVKVGHVYVAKVSDRLVPVRIDSVHSRQGWNATNTKTGRRVHIKSAQRLRREAAGSKPKDAAANAKAKENATLRAKPPADGQAAKPARSGKRRVPDSPGGVAMTVFRNQAVVNKAVANAAKPTAAKTAKPKRTSALDAAAIVLKDVGRPLNCKELIEMMAARQLWQSPNGKTPEATLYAAILRTISAKGDAAPFKKVGRGLFAFNG